MLTWVVFFKMQETPLKDHVALVSFHLEVDAQLWFQLLKQEKEVVMMGEFKEGLHSCYGPTWLWFLWRAHQVAADWNQTQFEKLLVKAGPPSQGHLVSCFVNGFKDSIKANVRESTSPKQIGGKAAYDDLSKTPQKERALCTRYGLF